MTENKEIELTSYEVVNDQINRLVSKSKESGSAQDLIAISAELRNLLEYRKELIKEFSNNLENIQPKQKTYIRST